MIPNLLLSALAGAAVALLLLIAFLPDRVQYMETIEVAAPAARVYDAIRFQEQLMAWSAWPSETQSQCYVQNPDGAVGAQTVYAKGQKAFGYQEITHLVEQEQVDFYLKSHVAPFEEDVRLSFRLKPLSAGRTEVSLWVSEKLRKPHFLIAYFGGILRWVHEMHLKDLAGLKAYVER
jgi:hypothetical protein